MLKKKIKYLDFNDEEHEEVYRFHLSKRELSELQLSEKGGLDKYLQSILDSQDARKIKDTFKEIILMSYGELSPDGKSFIKKDANGRSLGEQFEQTAAFDELFMELLTNPESATEFVTKIMPADIQKQIPENIKA